jgi:UDP-N-acetylglucosamine 2-epimerase (non-hydrolysing)
VRIRKIDVIFGTRPEAIKMAMICQHLKTSSPDSVRIISTGQHREMLVPVLKWFDVRPDVDLELMQSNQTLSGLTSRCITKLQEYYDVNGKPDLVLVQGDTTTAFACGLVAFYNRIMVGHVEAGLRTNNRFSPWPEEANRTLLSRIADLHFAPTKENVNTLLREGIDHAHVFHTGNTVIDALLFSKEKIQNSYSYAAQLEQFFKGDKANARLILVTGHRRENFGEGFRSICKGIRSLAADNRDVEFVYPVHLNPNVRDTVMSLLGGLANVHLIEPLGYADFVALMMRSYIILTDSGGVQEEGPSLGKPVLVMRENTERPEAVTHGTVRLVGTDASRIYEETTTLLQAEDKYKSMANATNPYGDGQSAKRIMKIIRDLE